MCRIMLAPGSDSVSVSLPFRFRVLLLFTYRHRIGYRQFATALSLIRDPDRMPDLT